MGGELSNRLEAKSPVVLEIVEIKVKIPEELRREMGELPGVEWGVLTRKLLKEEVERMRELKAIVSKSKLTEEDVEELSAEIDESLAQKFRGSLEEWFQLLLLVDANRVFSALLTRGKTFDVFLANKHLKKFEFIAPEFLFIEIGMHFDEILERSKLSAEELAKVFKFIKEETKFIPFEEFNKYADEAEKLAPHPKDVRYFALALASNRGIWSREEVFKRQQSRVKVFSTGELLELLEEK